MKIAIISFYSGLVDRGVETWSNAVKVNIGKKFDVVILGGGKYTKLIYFSILRHAILSTNVWSKADAIIPVNGGLQTLYCRLVSWVKRKPMVIFGHAGLGADDKWNLLCMPDVFVAFSETQKKWAQRHAFGLTRIVKINHAVDLKRFVPVGKKPRKKIVLCVAADTPLKQVNLVKSAVKRLKGFTYLGVGKGNDMEVPYGRMPQIYKQSDIFCFVPKPQEAFGIVYLEAMAANLPIVASDNPTRREIVGNAGIFVKNPQKLQDLSSAIKKAYDTDWGNKPRIQAEKFNWDNIAKQYEELFKSL